MRHVIMIMIIMITFRMKYFEFHIITNHLIENGLTISVQKIKSIEFKGRDSVIYK